MNLFRSDLLHPLPAGFQFTNSANLAAIRFDIGIFRRILVAVYAFSWVAFFWQLACSSQNDPAFLLVASALFASPDAVMVAGVLLGIFVAVYAVVFAPVYPGSICSVNKFARSTCPASRNHPDITRGKFVSSLAMSFNIWSFCGCLSSALSKVVLLPKCKARITSSAAKLIYSGIVRSKFVPSKAMSFLRVNCRRTYPAHSVLSGRYGFEMIWIYTGRISAKMVDLKAVWNNSFYKFKRKSMGSYIAVIKPEASVSSGLGTGPVPARGSFNDFRPKSILCGEFFHSGEDISWAI